MTVIMNISSEERQRRGSASDLNSGGCKEEQEDLCRGGDSPDQDSNLSVQNTKQE
jgi:hypothetical protein